VKLTTREDSLKVEGGRGGGGLEKASGTDEAILQLV